MKIATLVHYFPTVCLAGMMRVSALGCGLALAAAGLSGQTVVTIINPGFETQASTGGSTFADGWGSVPGTTGATFARVSGTAGNEVHTGSFAFKISNPSVNTTQARIQQASAVRFAVTPSETYTVSFWAKGTNLDLATDRTRISIEWWNAAGDSVVSTSTGSLLSLSSNDTWQQYSVGLTAIAPTNAAKAKILIFFDRAPSSTSTSPVITFDDIVVTVPSSIPEPSTVALLGGIVVIAFAGMTRRRR